MLPRAPVRQWVLSLPFELRDRLAWDHELCRAVLAVYTRALLGFYRKRAKASGHRNGRTGTVTVIQRFGGALNLNVHFHTLVVDGVFVREPDSSLGFDIRSCRRILVPRRSLNSDFQVRTTTQFRVGPQTASL